MLPKFPNLRTVETSNLKAIPITNQHLQIIAQFCPKLEVINLNIDPKLKKKRDLPLDPNDVGDDGLCALAAGCINLSQVSVEGRCNIRNAGVISLFNSGAKHLSMCYSISDEALKAIAEAKFITDLNLQGCRLITDYGLTCLASGSSSKSLRRLILAGCDRIRDLQKISGLEELDISYGSTKLTEIGFLGVSKIESLKKLSFSFMVDWPKTGLEYTPPSALRAFAKHESLESLVLAPCCYDIGTDNLEYTVLSCKSLKCVTIDCRLRLYIPLVTRSIISQSFELHFQTEGIDGGMYVAF